MWADPAHVVAHRDPAESEASRARTHNRTESPAPSASPLSVIARVLEVPTRGSVAEMVEGKLSDEGREPANVQAQIEEHEGAEYVLLADVDGVFLGPEAVSCSRESKDSDEESQAESIEGHCAEGASSLVSSLTDELTRVRGQVNIYGKSIEPN